MIMSLITIVSLMSVSSCSLLAKAGSSYNGLASKRFIERIPSSTFANEYFRSTLTAKERSIPDYKKSYKATSSTFKDSIIHKDHAHFSTRNLCHKNSNFRGFNESQLRFGMQVFGVMRAFDENTQSTKIGYLDRHQIENNLEHHLEGAFLTKNEGFSDGLDDHGLMSDSTTILHEDGKQTFKRAVPGIDPLLDSKDLNYINHGTSSSVYLNYLTGELVVSRHGNSSSHGVFVIEMFDDPLYPNCHRYKLTKGLTGVSGVRHAMRARPGKQLVVMATSAVAQAIDQLPRLMTLIDRKLGTKSFDAKSAFKEQRVERLCNLTLQYLMNRLLHIGVGLNDPLVLKETHMLVFCIPTNQAGENNHHKPDETDNESSVVIQDLDSD